MKEKLIFRVVNNSNEQFDNVLLLSTKSYNHDDFYCEFVNIKSYLTDIKDSLEYFIKMQDVEKMSVKLKEIELFVLDSEKSVLKQATCGLSLVHSEKKVATTKFISLKNIFPYYSKISNLKAIIDKNFDLCIEFILPKTEIQIEFTIEDLKFGIDNKK